MYRINSKNRWIISILFLSNAVLADTLVTAKLNYNHFVPRNMESSFGAHHEYSITNTTNSPLSYTVCFDMSACPEWQYYIKNTRICITVNVNPYTNIRGFKDTHLSLNYPFTGWCHLIAKTEIMGPEHAITQDSFQFQVG